MSLSIDLLSPYTKTPLHRLRDGEGWQADDGTIYPEQNGIIDLLDARLRDETLKSEINAFDELPISNVSYFRNILFDQVMDVITPYLKSRSRPQICLELGGGEGYFARSFQNRFSNSESYVCDISERFLKFAPTNLNKLRCDIRYPFMQKGSADLACFWVSFHHLSGQDTELALEVAVDTLAPGGLLMFFEPNNDFLPRRALYRSPLAKMIYFDDEEKGISFSDLAESLSKNDFVPVYKAGVSPPYSLRFLQNYKLWPLYFTATEFFYWLDKSIMGLSRSKQTIFNEDTLSMGSYLLTFFQRR